MEVQWLGLGPVTVSTWVQSLLRIKILSSLMWPIKIKITLNSFSSLLHHKYSS